MPFNFDTDTIIAFIKANGEYAPLVVFLMALGETIVVVSMFIPSTFLLFAIGGLMAASGVPLMPSLIAGGLGASLGFSVMFLVSATMQERLLAAWPFRNYPEMMQKTRDFAKKWGVMAVFIGHFMGPLRVLIPIVAGITHMRPAAFMAANIIGAFGWICVFFAPGYLLVSSDTFASTLSRARSPGSRPCSERANPAGSEANGARGGAFYRLAGLKFYSQTVRRT